MNNDVSAQSGTSPKKNNPVLAPILMVLNGVSLYAGAALAVGLFEDFSPALVAWMRIAAAAVILLVLYRPAVRNFLGQTGFYAALYGISTLAMNITFYEAIARIPMGTAVAIEFLGPIAVAALGSRTVRDWFALILAGVGVLVISGAQWSSNSVGVMFALAAALLWAIYIIAGNRIAGDASSSRMGMAVGFTWAAVLSFPLALWWWPGMGSTDLSVIQIIGLALSLGLLSAVIPYGLDQVVLRMAGRSYFAVLLAILPISAALMGALALGQMLSWAELVGIVLVVVAVALRRPTPVAHQ
ncbi:multidrug DMT transporter permease [Corynebacterium crudilactis]|uniref:Multidrug DMT transporter permease n=2 Tax=Corynebacterium crudilactis TaxID=1652495 RepID=A0A172QUQ6_9CORY|nr:multidrug DMT transporter permease [Corynebacterium crudilactis]